MKVEFYCVLLIVYSYLRYISINKMYNLTYNSNIL